MHLTLATFPVTFVSSRVFPSCHRWSFRQSRTLAPKSNIVTFLTNVFKNIETHKQVLSHAIVQRILTHACLRHVTCHQCWLCQPRLLGVAVLSCKMARCLRALCTQKVLFRPSAFRLSAARPVHTGSPKLGDLFNDFQASSARVKNLKQDPGNDHKLKLYALFKQVLKYILV